MTARQKKFVLAALLVVWAVIAAVVWANWESPPGAVPIIGRATEERTPLTGVLLRLRTDLLDRGVVLPDSRRDLFSGRSLEDTPTTAATEGPTTPPAPPPPIGAQLRYMGFVEMSAGTIALLSEGVEMYLARAGERVGPGYLVTLVEPTFVEIEFRGARRRLPVYGAENGTTGVQDE